MSYLTGYPQSQVHVGAATGYPNTVSVNGQQWSSVPQVNGYPQAAGGAVIALETGRKLVVIGVGGFYPAMNTYPTEP